MKIGNMPLPVAVIISALVISGAIIYGGGDRVDSDTTNKQVVEQNTEKPSPESTRPVDKDDHIYGNVDAPIKVVEFSDIECPYCAKIHPTLKQLVDSSNGQVAWVFRHFPLSGHQNAVVQAVGAECAAKLGGNNKFWEYLDFAFENQSIGGKESVIEVGGILGLNSEDFRSCVESDEFIDDIDQDKQDAINSGGRGTPHSVIIAPNDVKVALSGAQSLQTFQQVITKIISEQ